MAAAAAVIGIGTVDEDADALMSLQADHALVAFWHSIQTFTRHGTDSERCRRQTREQTSLCVRVSGVSWRPLANVSQADCAAQFKCYLSASTVASASAAVTGGNVGRCVYCRHRWSLVSTCGQAHPRCMYSGLNMSSLLVWVCHITFHRLQHAGIPGNSSAFCVK